MNLTLFSQHETQYTIHTPVYEGPLDLLLQLIERAELDITSLALAQVTDQYLAYLHTLEEKHADEVSAFLVIAARLVQIKSSVLLPRPSLSLRNPEEEEDPGEALARQLILYKRFKELAVILKEREEEGLRTYLRIAAVPPKTSTKLDLSGISLMDIVQVAREVLFNKPQLTDLDKVVKMPRVTIRQKIHAILEALRQKTKTTFSSILQNRTRMEIVVSFLAMLELVKRRIVEASQENLFGDIVLQPLADWDDSQEMETEFKD